MLALERVSAINDVKGTKECRDTACFQARKVTIATSVVKIPSSVFMVKISLQCSTTRSTRTLGRMTLTFSDPPDFSQLKLGLCLPPKCLHEYACTFSLKLPQSCCWRRHCFGKDPWCSPYLLQVIKPSFSQSLA